MVSKRATTRRVQKGRGVMDKLRAAHNFVRSKRLVSSVLARAGHPKFAAVARQLGYGRKKPVARRRPAARGRPAARRRVTASRSGVVRAPRPRKIALPRSRMMRGRGFFGKTLGGIGGGLLGGLLPF